MNLVLVLALVTVLGTQFAARTPNRDDLVASFHDAQAFYAEGAYDQAIVRYEEVLQVRSRLLDTQKISVSVGSESFPLLEAANYQIGNAYSKLFTDFSRFAGEARDPERREGFQAQADSAFARSVRAFRQVSETAANQVLRVQAFGRLVDLYFEAGRYPEVIEAADAMIAAYPGEPRAVGGYYNRGWAFYEMQNYPRAIAAFKELLELYPTGYQADRSLFQIGESYQEQGEYLQAIEHYRRLVKGQRIEELTEEQLNQMRREKLAGLVDETALELAAKAEIRVGNCFTKLERYDEGLAAYRRVIALFSTERRLVEEAYLRMADLYQEQGDLAMALQTYREAIDQSTDRTLRARIQYALAERLFARGQYEQAIQEYRIYLRGYGDIVGGAGFSLERVRYRIGSAYQQMAQARLGEDDRAGASDLLDRAIAQYDTVLSNEGSPYGLDARFNRALAHQSQGGQEALDQAQSTFEVIVGEGRDRGYVQRALVQLGELYYSRGEYEASAQRAWQLLDRFPESDYAADAYMRLALARQALGDPGGAIQAFLAVDPESPHFARARLGSGHTLVTQGQLTEAIPVLTAGLERADDGQRASFHYLIGQAHNGEGAYQRSIDHFSQALEHVRGGSRLEEALRFSRGNTAFVVENYALAEEDFRWIVDHVEDPEKVRSAENALSLSYLKQDRGGEAIQILDDMVTNAESPEEQAEILGRMMDLYYERDDYGQTVRFARRVISLSFADELGPGQTILLRERAYFVLGDALSRLGRGDEAVEVFGRALDQYPESEFAADMRLALGIHYFDRDQLDRAKEVFGALRQAGLEPNQDLLVRFYLANAHYSMREFEDAQREFIGLLSDYPRARELPDMLFGAAESYYQLGEFAAALGLYDRILAEFPAETAADNSHYNKAWCLIELKRDEEAMETMAELLRRYPESEFAASAQFTLGDYAYNRQAYQEAIDTYNKVRERYADAPVAEQVPRLIAELEESVAYEFYERGLALMDSADVTKEQRYFEEAIEVFEQVMERYPETESALGSLSNLGVCLEGLNKWKDAVEVYDQVIGLYEDKRASREVFQFAKSHRDWIVSTRL